MNVEYLRTTLHTLHDLTGLSWRAQILVWDDPEGDTFQVKVEHVNDPFGRSETSKRLGARAQSEQVHWTVQGIHLYECVEEVIARINGWIKRWTEAKAPAKGRHE